MKNKETFIGLGIFNSSMNDKARAICVVCDMIVSKKTHFTTKFKNKRYYFCCENCKSSFIKNPYKYTLG
jgi:YHS domain-containing protein